MNTRVLTVTNILMNKYPCCGYRFSALSFFLPGKQRPVISDWSDLPFRVSRDIGQANGVWCEGQEPGICKYTLSLLCICLCCKNRHTENQVVGKIMRTMCSKPSVNLSYFKCCLWGFNLRGRKMESCLTVASALKVIRVYTWLKHVLNMNTNDPF